MMGNDRFNFILLNGVLGWGLPTWLLFCLLLTFGPRDPFSIRLADFASQHWQVPVWLLCGYFFGAALWAKLED